MLSHIQRQVHAVGYRGESEYINYYSLEKCPNGLSMKCTKPPSVKKSDLKAGNINVELPSEVTAVCVFPFSLTLMTYVFLDKTKL